MTAVSVLIASFNHARYLRQTLESVLGQTLSDLELIVVDDGSSDGSWEILQEYAAHDKRLQVHSHPGRSNRGVSATVNLGLAKARGRYMAWLGSDDLWDRRFLEAQTRIFSDKPSVGLVCGRAFRIDAEGRPLGVMQEDDISKEKDPVCAMLLDRRIHALTTVFRRECIARVGMLDERLDYSDWELWVRILALYRAAHNKEPLASYRVHGGNMSLSVGREREIARHIAALTSLREKVTTIGGFLQKPHNRSLIELQLAAHLYCLGRDDEAESHVRAAARIDGTLRTSAWLWVKWIWYWETKRRHLLAERVREFRRFVASALASSAARRLRARVMRGSDWAMCFQRWRWRAERYLLGW